tara:strand:+ start:11396 stop:12790 length:1395 start_codon:yes stop_codon:yes gene_type:complete
MEHQVKSICHAAALPGFHIWAPPGSGKTLCGLVWLELKASQQESFKLVVTKAGARGTWREEVRKYTNQTPVVLKGKKPPKLTAWSKDTLYITAWETLIDWAPIFLRDWKNQPVSLVFDEIHYAKNPKRVRAIVSTAGRTKFQDLDNISCFAKKLSKLASNRLGLTATPIPNRLRDLWAPLDLVEPYCWGNFHGWGVRYCGAFQDSYGWKYNDISNVEELKERLDYCKFKTSQRAISKSLPTKRRQVVYLEPEEQNAPSGFKNDIRRASQSSEKESMFETLLQESASRKRKYVVDRVLEALSFGQKVVVFTGRRKDCDRLGNEIKSKVTNGDFWCAHGGTSTGDRDKIRHEFMGSPGPAVLVGTGDAWGESVNLQDADLVFFVMLPWTPRAIRQWEGRFCRLGQERPVLISYVICRGTVDEHVADILIDKLPAVQEIAGDKELEHIESAFESSCSDLLSRVSSFI